jgi:hypothetical protein
MEQHAEWCRSHFARMKPGGLWMIPRTGLVFRRTGNVLLWVAVIPPVMPNAMLSPADLAKVREAEFEDNANHFTHAGVIIQRAIVIKPFASFDDATRFYMEQRS